MTGLKEMRDWLHKHWSVIRSRPANGEHALAEIEPILQEMRDNNARVRKAVDEMVEETDEGKRIMANDHIINNHHA